MPPLAGGSEHLRHVETSRVLGHRSASTGAEQNADSDARSGSSAHAGRPRCSTARPYRGRFVARKDDRVLFDANTPQEVLAWLSEQRIEGAVVFRVPVDPTVDMGSHGMRGSPSSVRPPGAPMRISRRRAPRGRDPHQDEG